ncbi:glutamate racemase [Pacificimonas flava]|uniref:Glutamate racemase n=2 Tax=Pacificimonas TaxID=1960290 RepID=A0A219B6A9_9SPHN|nr:MULTISPECIES: glutamate racemase [Pacificimonas]MBZ6379071.1 glutamate racemase [Pacificimonas aurantium]OWV33693.1 glutamate racemase [Pacificimonas flava]
MAGTSNLHAKLASPLPVSAGPILIFDSGIGGLSVAGPIMQRVPAAPIVYAADNAGFPYGSKTEMQVASRVSALLGKLSERFDPALIVIACNTASTIALDHVRAVLDIPIVGTVPAIKPAAEQTRTGVIGVLGTPATVRQRYVDDLEQKFASGKTVLRWGTPGLAEAAEAVMRGEDVAAEEFARPMRGLLDQPGGERMDKVVLACTHFPLVEDRLAAAAGRPLDFLHGGEGIARRTASLLENTIWGGDPDRRIVFTEAANEVARLRGALESRGFAAPEFL